MELPKSKVLTFGDLVEQHWRESGLNRSEAARRSRVNRATLWRGEWGEGPRLKTALRIMRALGIPYERLAEVES